MAAVKRLLLICGIATLLTAPAAMAAPSLNPSCSVCQVGVPVTVTASGFSDKASYFWTVASVNNGSEGTFTPLAVTGGQAAFSFAPWAADQYEVRVWIKSGRNLKVVSDIWLTAV